MRIAFIVPFTNTYNLSHTGVWGDCILVEAIAKSLNKKGIQSGVHSVPDFKTEKPYDIAIHTNDLVHTMEFSNIAKKHYLWIQGIKAGIVTDGLADLLDPEQIYEGAKHRYEKVFTLSKTLAERKNIPFVPCGVDMESYHPIEREKRYEITFLGNLIKPQRLNEQYMRPMGRFDYYLAGGVFGKVSHERGIEIVAQSEINLHFGYPHTLPWNMVIGRPLQNSACRGFTMMDEVPYMMEVYKDAMAFTKGGEDEIEKIHYYLSHQKEREDMAHRAYEITKQRFDSNIVAEKILEVL